MKKELIEPVYLKESVIEDSNRRVLVVYEEKGEKWCQENFIKLEPLINESLNILWDLMLVKYIYLCQYPDEFRFRFIYNDKEYTLQGFVFNEPDDYYKFFEIDSNTDNGAHSNDKYLLLVDTFVEDSLNIKEVGDFSNLWETIKSF
jgi:hypothetical protein